MFAQNNSIAMVRIRPLLIFITLSLGLHWLVLSEILNNPPKKVLPQVKNPTDRVSVEIVKKSLIPAPIIDPEKQALAPQPVLSSRDNDALFESQPPVLIGSPWNRRPLDRQGNNFHTSPQSNSFYEINLVLNNLQPGNQHIEAIECNLKNLATKPAYECSFSANSYFTKDIEKILNAQLMKSLASMPNCISLLYDQKKWHTFACQKF
jgi:hypothetical protein